MNKLIYILLLLPLGTLAQQEKDFSETAIAGYALTGIGATVIGYQALGYNDKANQQQPAPARQVAPAVYYIAGGALMAAGIGLVIYGHKNKKEDNYWKGMSMTLHPARVNLQYSF